MTRPAQRLAMPYPGLRPFESEDQPLFFGREAQVAAMLHQLEDHRFVAVVGSSGSGKSSLVRAGLLPAIGEGFLLGSSSWLSLIIKPGHQPYARLGCRLYEATHSASEAAAARTDPGYHDPALAIAETLRRSDRGLLEALAKANVSPGLRVMVVVDQFEELFAFRRKEASRDEVASRDESASFVRMLLRSASDPSGRVWVVLTMRSDFIGNCEAFLGLPEAVSRSQFLVPRLDREQMEEAIRCPGEVEGAGFRPFTFAEGLINRIINEAGDRPDQLPLLQHALMRTWKLAVQRALTGSGPVELTHGDYEEAGRIDHALSLHADTAWRSIADDPHKANLTRQLFLLLCDVSPDGQITRRRPKVTQVVAVTGSSITEIEEVVRLFQSDDRNFLLPPLEEKLASDTYLDVSHEALLRQWEIFANDWLVRERSDAEELRLLVKQANDYVGSRGGLLGEEDLKRILDWRTRVSLQWAGRYVTEKQWDGLVTFIQESSDQLEQRRREKARQARVRRRLAQALGIVLMLATLVSVGFAVKAYRAENVAVRQRTAAVAALVRSFVRPIGSRRYWSASKDEQEALWELAALDPADENVRHEVIRYWLTTEDGLSRALVNEGLGLHAAIGLNRSVRSYFDSQTGGAAEILVKALEDQQGQECSRLSGLGETLAALAAHMNGTDINAVADRLTRALERAENGDRPACLAGVGMALAYLAKQMNPENASMVADRGALVLVAAVEKREMDSENLSDCSEALAALVARMNSSRAAEVADRAASVLTAALERPAEPDDYHIASLGNSLAALAARMNPTSAARTATRLVRMLQHPPESDHFAQQQSGLGEALAGAATRLNANDAATTAALLATALEDLQPQDSPDRLSSLGKALAAVAQRMNSDDAARVAARLTLALQRVKVEKGDFPQRLSSLGVSLAALMARMNPKDVAVLADRGASALAVPLEIGWQVPEYDLANLCGALEALADGMNPRNAATLAVRLASLLERSLARRDRDYLSSALCKTLEALAARMNSQDAATVATRLAQKLLERSLETGYALRSLGDMLAALGARMDPTDAATLAARFATALERRQGTNIAWLSASGEALAGLARRMNAEEAVAVTGRGALVLAKAAREKAQTADSSSMTGLGNALAALAAQIPNRQQAQLVALSLLLLNKVPDTRGLSETEAQEGRKAAAREPVAREAVARSAALLTARELVDVLKWPFCVGEAQKLVLAELERKTLRSFGGDLWKFVEQVESLGINGLNRQFLDLPAKRPRIEGAITELQALVRSTASRNH